MKSALPLALLSAISVSVFSSGCASIVNSGTKPGITVTTKVPGARVLVDGNEVGTTPLTVRPKGTGKHVVRVEGDGREPAETVMYKSWEPWFLGNLILGGIIGVAVDFGTGHWACYDPPEWNPDATPSEKASDPALAEPAPRQGQTRQGQALGNQARGARAREGQARGGQIRRCRVRQNRIIRRSRFLRGKSRRKSKSGVRTGAKLG